MARTFYTSGILQQQQTRSANTSKIPIYANESALDADLANIPDNTLVATSSGHDDVIDQMKEYIRKQNSPDWNNAQSITISNNMSYTALDDGWNVGVLMVSEGNGGTVKINNVKIAGSSSILNVCDGFIQFQVKISKGDVFTIDFNVYKPSSNPYNSLSFIPHK